MVVCLVRWALVGLLGVGLCWITLFDRWLLCGCGRLLCLCVSLLSFAGFVVSRLFGWLLFAVFIVCFVVFGVWVLWVLLYLVGGCCLVGGFLCFGSFWDDVCVSF